MSELRKLREKALKDYAHHKAEMNKAQIVVQTLNKLASLVSVKIKKRTISQEARHKMSLAAKRRWRARRAQ